MIVDTSALIAILLREDGSELMIAALAGEPAGLPAPARLEFMRVASGQRLGLAGQAARLLAEFDNGGMETVAFTAQHADLAVQANERFGKGNGTGGELNLLDLMVYAVARERREPLLFAGADFATTDVQRHLASRLY